MGEGVLNFLRNVTCDFKENGNFTLFFHFDKNDYFDHEVLTREFILDEKKLTISKIVSSKIEWKSEDVNPTIEKKKKKIKKKKEEMEDDEDEEDEMDIIEDEYDLGLSIKEEVIPYAIEYYLGVTKNEAEDEDDLEPLPEEGDEDDDEE